MAIRTISGSYTGGQEWTKDEYFHLGSSVSVSGTNNPNGTITSVTLAFTRTISTFDTLNSFRIYINGEPAGVNTTYGAGEYKNFTITEYSNIFLTASITSVAIQVEDGSFYAGNGTYTITVNYSEPVTQPTLTRPGDPVITYTPGASTFRVSWSPAYGSNGTGIVTYNLFMQGSGSVVSNEPVTSYTGPVPEAGTYIFRVTANYPGAESQQSNAISYTFEKATVTTPTLTAPTNLRLSASSGEEVTLTWTEAQLNNSEINYAIKYEIGYFIAGQEAVQWPSGFSTYSNNFLINKQWFLDNNIPNGTEVQFWLEASVAAYSLFQHVKFPNFKVILSENEKKQNSVGYYVDGAWQECAVYYYDGSEWVECIPYYYDNGWQEINTKIE